MTIIKIRTNSMLNIFLCFLLLMGFGFLAEKVYSRDVHPSELFSMRMPDDWKIEDTQYNLYWLVTSDNGREIILRAFPALKDMEYFMKINDEQCKNLGVTPEWFKMSENERVFAIITLSDYNLTGGYTRIGNVMFEAMLRECSSGSMEDIMRLFRLLKSEFQLTDPSGGNPEIYNCRWVDSITDSTYDTSFTTSERWTFQPDGKLSIEEINTFFDGEDYMTTRDTHYYNYWIVEGKIYLFDSENFSVNLFSRGNGQIIIGSQTILTAE